MRGKRKKEGLKKQPEKKGLNREAKPSLDATHPN